MGLTGESLAATSVPKSLKMNAECSEASCVAGSGLGWYAVMYKPYNRFSTIYRPTNFAKKNTVGLNSFNEIDAIFISLLQ